MAVYEGNYKSFLQGVSQQTAQERRDGQLGEQINMLSDPVTGLRRRGGVRLHNHLPECPSSSFMQVVRIGNDSYLVAIDTTTGKIQVYPDLGAGAPKTLYNDYLTCSNGKESLRTALINNKLYVLNTERVPSTNGNHVSTINPSNYGYFSIRSSAFSMSFDIRLEFNQSIIEIHMETSDTEADMATPEYVATRIVEELNNKPEFTAAFTAYRLGSTVGIRTEGAGTLNITTSNTHVYVQTSGTSRVANRNDIISPLPAALDGYILAVGEAQNSAYYQYDSDSNLWAECSAYTARQAVTGMPIHLSFNANNIGMGTMYLNRRVAGDANNNPMPVFVDYGITGISAYQSRLILLSGSYVCMSKTNDPHTFMRTTVTDVLDDDPIEIASSALSSAQFEYAIPYNKDLILIARDYQAVIPANSTVLSAKTAVLYPSTNLELSLAVAPTTVGKTLYYVYQRGADYYQVGEFIPNSYTDSQYYAQNLTEHLPLYAKGVCSVIASSTTNNMVVFGTGSRELLVNQYIWQGDDRPLMSFHKWVMPYPVKYMQFIQAYLVIYMDDGSGGTYVGTLNVQLNQLDDKPIPFTDLYQHVTTIDGVGTLEHNVPMDDAVVSVYDDRNIRHKAISYEYNGARAIRCHHDGAVVVGLPYESTFKLTPPFVKDEQGRVIIGARTTIKQLSMTFKYTGNFEVTVQDSRGISYNGSNDTALTWSETELNHTWLNPVSNITIPCRTQLSSTECTVTTKGTTELNLLGTEYVLRMAQKRRRL